MPRKQSRNITLVLLTAGALLSQVTGCPTDRLREADTSGGGIYYRGAGDSTVSSGYYGGGGYHHVFHGSYHSGISHGGFGGRGSIGG
jgi:hypothetical protein